MPALSRGNRTGFFGVPDMRKDFANTVRALRSAGEGEVEDMPLLQSSLKTAKLIKIWFL
jgi:hypothetical protein